MFGRLGGAAAGRETGTGPDGAGRGRSGPVGVGRGRSGPVGAGRGAGTCANPKRLGTPESPAYPTYR